MTSQGSPVSVLRRAIRGGNLRSVELALIDVPQLDLEDALDVLALMARDGDQRRWTWAERWRTRISASEAERLQRLLDQLPDPGAVEALRALAVQLRGASPSTRLVQP